MSHRFAEITFTDSVKAAQEHYGSRLQNDRLRNKAGPNNELTTREADFIQNRDTFYVATVNDSGWPYVQHRGGPPGFLKVLDPNRLTYADYRGNTQLISTGNLSQNNRCSLILMDYPNRRRLKLLGHMHIEDVRAGLPGVVEQFGHDGYEARIERIVTIDVVAFDWNCPQHITRRYTESEFVNYQER